MAFGGVLGTATVAGCLASAFGGVLGPGTPDLAPAALVASAPAFALAYVSLRNLSDSPGFWWCCLWFTSSEGYNRAFLN